MAQSIKPNTLPTELLSYIPLSDRSKELCGILPYFGSPIYRYEVLPMGIACAPQIWMDYITLILGELEQNISILL